MGVPARKGAAALRKQWADAKANCLPLYMSARLVQDDVVTVEEWAVAATALQQQRRHKNGLSDKESDDERRSSPEQPAQQEGESSAGADRVGANRRTSARKRQRG